MMASIIPQLKNIGKSATLQINETSSNLEKKGRKVYRFGFGQSPFPVPALVVNELKKYANEKSYLPVEGLHELRRVISDHYVNEQSLDVSLKNILVGPGSKELMYILQMVLDCTVIIPSPSWVSYEPQSIILNKKHIFLDTSYKSKWKITESSLEEKCKKIKGLKLLILNYPNNPTGLSYTKEDLKSIAKICKENHTLVLSDEIYSRLHHRNDHVSLSKYYPEGTIITSGLSKWCGAGGWRLGTMIIPDELKKIKQAIINVSSETFSCVSSPIQYASVMAYKDKKYGYPCYRCLFPEAPPKNMIPTCSEVGVLGALCGMIGSLQAAEIIKEITNYGDTLAGSLIIFDGLRTDFRKIKIKPDPECALCGKNATIKDLSLHIR